MLLCGQGVRFADRDGDAYRAEAHLSADMPEDASMTGGIGTAMYLATELLAGERIVYDSAVDMYRCGATHRTTHRATHRTTHRKHPP